MAVYFGADYYPEHWPRERWATDAALMEEMGIDVVRMAEFSWEKMEPREGEFHFEWLEEAISLLAAHGIKTVLGTPSAAPPAWIIEKNPEIQPIDSNGIQHHFGGRHHDCQSNVVYREHIRRFVTKMAQTFKDNPNVIGWQIDNELGNSHGDLCFCPSCENRFRDWLQKKYTTVEALNKAWGTAFWSQGYSSFEQVQAPKITAAGKNPSQMLDWKRFCSDLIVEFQQFQIDIIHSICPARQFITHNFMGFADKVSYFDLGKSLDFASHDQYPGGYFAQAPHQPNERLAAELDFVRGTKEKNFWIMEQQSGITGWECMGRAPKPGQLSMWSVQSIAHGADTVVYFRWRVCTVGTEQYWHGILPHSGKPGRRYEELKAFIHKMRPLMAEIQGVSPKPEVGIVFSYDQEYAMQIQPHNPKLTYIGQVMKYYTGFYNKNIPVDFVSDQSDFSRYKLLIAPLQYLMDPALEKKYADYVRSGGHLVLTMRTGVKDRNNICMSDRELPGALSEVVGLEVSDYDCLWETSLKVRWGDQEYTAEQWSDLIELKGASSLAECASEFYAGSPAVTVNSYGKGLAYYVGNEPAADLMDRLVEELTEKAGVSSVLETPEGVEVMSRRKEDTEYIFVLNHTEEEQEISVPAEWKNYFEGQEGALPPFGFRVYTKAL